jgi:hypothetical protein
MSYLKLRTKHKKWDDDLFFGTEEPNFYRQLNASSKIEGKYTFDGSVLVLNWGSSSISLRLNGQRFVSQNMIIYVYGDVSKLVNTSKDAKKHESVKAPEPEPVKAPEPEPVKAPEPEPVKAPEPEPVKAPEPEPVKAPEPEPVKAPEPEPVKAPEPEPVKAPDPEPVKQATKSSNKKKNESLAAEPMSPYMNFSEL